MINAQSGPASAPIRYGLRATAPADVAIVRGWLAEPHVTRWWPNPEHALRSITQHLVEPAIECFILAMDGRDDGYLQVYDPHHAHLPLRTSKRVSTPTAASHAARAASTSSLARPGSSDEVTDLASSGVSSTTSSRGEYPAW
jgi:Acetyltransferase (GNAT) domain